MVLDKAVQSRTRVDMQEIFLELTTRLMGIVAYDVCPMGAFVIWSAH